jgi:maltose alpha-D-glucosyltransferase/alpha-amylase
MKKDDLWYKDAVFYQVSVRAYKDSNGDGFGDLRGLEEKLQYIHDLGIDCIWLMPIYPSPLRDDGYDIADYYNVADMYGNIEDLKSLVRSAHALDIRIIMDLVLNHTSDEHPWFKASRADRTSPYRNYYVWSDTDKRYKNARIIFLDTEVSNWTYDEKTGQYYWHRFYASQPDLNFDNPQVQEEMFNVARFWLDLGIDGFRADAVPYLFEREGTNCENLEETHAYLKKLRAFMDQEYPGRILLCEANQWPEDVRPYFGDGDEFQMGFHFPIMPRIYMALKKERPDDMIEILRRTPPIPENCQWCMFLRNHDELTLEMVTEEERHWMWQQYAPEPRMKLNLGIRRRLSPLLDNDRRKIELANSLLFTLPGSPIIYYGDEIGMGDNIELFDRNGVRTPMQWDDSDNAGFTTGKPFADVIQGDLGYKRINVAAQMADPGSQFHSISRMVNIRKQHQAFGRGAMEWLITDNPHLAMYTRKTKEETLIIIQNLSGSAQSVPMPNEYHSDFIDLLSNVVRHIDSSLTLQPYEYLWLKRK